ncbi:MAG TPA: S1 RNA-binding domain-containing protein, partial [Ktedonobacteraceae bacterium]|nr:S1 RNA-binding domain-containing protein [Ktedonobacteraceae bacterium]
RPIEQAVATLRQLIKSDEKLAGTVDVLPLYTTLPQEEQDKALKAKPDPNRRRVVITTNVAETSLTVEGVVYVVDSGLINEAQWDPESQTKQIVTIPHSQAGCEQRWGRGGRVRDGQAYCLYTKEQFTTIFPRYSVPQIQRSPLEQVVLNAKVAGIDDVGQFDWIEKPPEQELERAPRILRDLGALDELDDLTPLGIDLQTFADEPTLAKIMVMADRFACAIEMATLLPMIKMGGHRYLLHWDRKWDANTRRAVNRIHRALMKGCHDDIEFGLKLYKAWSETEYDGEIIAPDWAIRDVWPRYVPPLPSKLKEALSEDDAKKFRDQAAATPDSRTLFDLVRLFGLEQFADDWLMDVETALLRARREAWAKAFFINHSIFKNKVDPERELLLDALSGHKKEEERRPVNLELLDRVRIILAYCLTERRYEGFPSTDAQERVDDSNSESTYAYRPHKRMPSEEQIGSQTPIIIQINRDSVCAGRDIDGFVCGKQQVVLRQRSPKEPPTRIMYVSYLSLVKPEWWEWLEQPRHSQVALGQFISAQTRDEATGELTSTYAYERLFLDQIVSVGSRHQCQVMDVHTDGMVQLGFIRRLSDQRKVEEDFRGDEPTITAMADTVDEMDVEAGDLVDTVLNLEDAVPNIEEDETPPWVGLADDTWEVETATSSINSSPPNSETAMIPTVQSSLEEQYNRSLQAHLMRPTASDPSSEEDSIADWPDRPIGHLQNSSATYRIGDVLPVEVVDYDFDNAALPKVILQPVPNPEPFDIFMRQYSNRIGDTITVIATAYDERPGDSLVSLVVREPVSGLEILLEPEQLSFTIRGLLVKEIPLGIELQAVIEYIDEDRGRVYLSCLPVVEAHLNEKLRHQRPGNRGYEIGAVVGAIVQERVFLILEWSEPAQGLLHIVSTGGGGLYKPAEAYLIGETCKVRLWFPDKPSTKGLDELPEEIKAIIDVQRIFQNLFWESGVLKFNGRISYSLRNDLQRPTKDKNYRRAVETLYRYSNQLMAQTIDIEWPIVVRNKYPVGTQVPNARITRIESYGAFAELEPRVTGLIFKSQMVPGGTENPEEIVEIGELVEVRVIKVDFEEHRISLSMLSTPTYNLGDKVRGKVVDVKEYGAFIELTPGTRGLLHRNEMWGNIPDVTKVLKVGDEMEIKIVSMENGKLALSTKRIPESNPLLKYDAGFRARGKIIKVEEYGAFVELEPGVSGLVHKSKMGGYVPDVRRVVKVGDEINVVVLSVNMEKQNLSLSM